MKVKKVLLRDYVNPNFKEIVKLEVPENSTLTETAKEYMKNGYGGKIYTQKWNSKKFPDKKIKGVFSNNTDFFLMWGVKS